MLNSLAPVCLVVFLSACLPAAAPQSSLAVLETTALKTACTDKRNHNVQSQTTFRTGNWIALSYFSDPCWKKARGYSLADNGNPSNLAVIIPMWDSEDGRIDENARRLATLNQQQGNSVIVARPEQIDSKITEFRQQNPSFDPNNVSIFMHGHGQTVTSDGSGGQVASDTLLGESGRILIPSTDPLGELPFEEVTDVSAHSAQQLSYDTLTSLQRNNFIGGAGDNNNCLIAIGSCESGGAVQAMQENLSDWQGIGMDAVIGASEANQNSFDDYTAPAGIPSEMLLSRMSQVQTDPQLFQAVDTNSDGMVSIAEFQAGHGGPSMVNFEGSTMSIGTEIAPQGVSGQSFNEVTQIGVDPLTEEPIFQNDQSSFTNMVVAGDENTVLATKPQISEPQGGPSSPADLPQDLPSTDSGPMAPPL